MERFVQKLCMALALGGLLMSAAVANAQEMAVAVPPPKGAFMVFAEKNNALSPTALSTIRSAAGEASGRQVTLSGRPENVAPVKAALEKAGVPAGTIAVERDAGAALPRPGDGLSEPTDRRVEIRL
jgi:hypothetical protein